MPEISHVQFKHKEVVQALLRQAGIHEGRWQLVIAFGLAAANMGPSPSEVSPGAAVAVTSIGLARAQPDSPEALVVDAAEINPEPA